MFECACACVARVCLCGIGVCVHACAFVGVCYQML